MNNQPNIFMALDKTFEESEIVVFGAPYDGTVSYRPGTRFGPQAIRQESFGVETYSPYQEKDLEDTKVFDAGDLELPFGNRDKTLKIIHDMAKEILDKDKIPFMIGGEHLVTLPAFQAACDKYKDIVILHFDAHADLREEYMGEPLSHACVIQQCYQYMNSKEIYQFGIRSMTKEEHQFAKQNITQEAFTADTLPEIVQKIKGKPVYLTIDLDVLDPSIFSGTGTPEPGGLTYKELQKAILEMKDLNIVALDVNELSPDYDSSKVSTVTACKIIRELILMISK